MNDFTKSFTRRFSSFKGALPHFAQNHASNKDASRINFDLTCGHTFVATHLYLHACLQVVLLEWIISSNERLFEEGAKFILVCAQNDVHALRSGKCQEKGFLAFHLPWENSYQKNLFQEWKIYRAYSFVCGTLKKKFLTLLHTMHLPVVLLIFWAIGNTCEESGRLSFQKWKSICFSKWSFKHHSVIIFKDKNSLDGLRFNL